MCWSVRAVVSLFAAIGGLLEAGCAALPVFSNSAEWQSLEEQEHTSSDVAASREEPLSFVHNRQRHFPAQGWWCRDFEEWLTPERVERGYTLVFPGVEGTSFHNIGIARGLVEAGHPAAIEVRDWTTGRAPLFFYHLMALERNKQRARDIAQQIVEYQQQHPRKPVTLIGHSGGAAMALLVLDALPEEHRVTQVILLAAAISPDFDLTTALSRTERGITNFYSWGDVPHLVLGTLAMGTIDRKHSISAGASGFRMPGDLTEQGHRLYETRLEQVPYRLAMAGSFNLGGHTGPTMKKFVANWVAPRLAVN